MGESVAVNGAQLAYREYGDGAPVILVHGSNSDLRTWESVIAPLAERHRTIAYSRRYHWPNSPIEPGTDYSMQQHVDDLAALIDLKCGKPVSLVGHSYGGFVCLLLALQHPQLVKGLVLIEPPVLTLFVSNQPKPAELMRLFMTRPAVALSIVRFGMTGVSPALAALKRGDTDGAMVRMSKAVLGNATYAALDQERLQQAKDNMIPEELTGSGFLPLDAAQLAELQHKVLLVDGEFSRRLFHHFSCRLLELLPNARRATVSKASHIVHEDNPDGWTSAVVPFLQELEG